MRRRTYKFIVNIMLVTNNNKYIVTCFCVDFRRRNAKSKTVINVHTRET